MLRMITNLHIHLKKTIPTARKDKVVSHSLDLKKVNNTVEKFVAVSK